MQTPAFKILDFLISIPIIKDVMFSVYRKQVVDKAEKMGLAWTNIMNEMWANIGNLKKLAKSMEDPNVVIPDYYYAPIPLTMKVIYAGNLPLKKIYGVN